MDRECIPGELCVDERYGRIHEFLSSMHLLATDEWGYSIHGWQFQSVGRPTRLLMRLVMGLARTNLELLNLRYGGGDIRLGHSALEIIAQKGPEMLFIIQAILHMIGRYAPQDCLSIKQI